MFKLPRYFHYYDNNNDLTKVRLEKVEISWKINILLNGGVACMHTELNANKTSCFVIGIESWIWQTNQNISQTLACKSAYCSSDFTIKHRIEFQVELCHEHHFFPSLSLPFVVLIKQISKVSHIYSYSRNDRPLNRPIICEKQRVRWKEFERW